MCLFCLMAMGCEHSGLFFGLAEKPKDFHLELTGLSIPLVIGIVLAAWFIGAAFGGRHK